MSNRGRSTTGSAAVPYYVRIPTEEAARHLRLTVTRYLAERANIGDIEEAMEILKMADAESRAAKKEGT